MYQDIKVNKIADDDQPVKLVTEDQNEFLVAKQLLRSKSPFFRRLLRQEDPNTQNEDTYLVSDVSGGILQQVLDYLGGQSIYIGVYNALELAQIAKVFELVDLQMKCDKFLRHSLTRQTCCQIYQKAKDYNIQQLQQTCINYALKHFTGVTKDPSFMYAPPDFVMELLRSEKVRAREKDLFDMAMEWFQSMAVERQQFLDDCLSLIRFGTMNVNEVALVADHPYVLRSVKLQRLLVDALICIATQHKPPKNKTCGFICQPRLYQLKANTYKLFHNSYSNEGGAVEDEKVGAGRESDKQIQEETKNGSDVTDDEGQDTLSQLDPRAAGGGSYSQRSATKERQRQQQLKQMYNLYQQKQTQLQKQQQLSEIHAHKPQQRQLHNLPNMQQLNQATGRQSQSSYTTNTSYNQSSNFVPNEGYISEEGAMQGEPDDQYEHSLTEQIQNMEPLSPDQKRISQRKASLSTSSNLTFKIPTAGYPNSSSEYQNKEVHLRGEDSIPGSSDSSHTSLGAFDVGRNKGGGSYKKRVEPLLSRITDYEGTINDNESNANTEHFQDCNAEENLSGERRWQGDQYSKSENPQHNTPQHNTPSTLKGGDYRGGHKSTNIKQPLQSQFLNSSHFSSHEQALKQNPEYAYIKAGQENKSQDDFKLPPRSSQREGKQKVRFYSENNKSLVEKSLRQYKQDVQEQKQREVDDGGGSKLEENKESMLGEGSEAIAPSNRKKSNILKFLPSKIKSSFYKQSSKPL